MVLTALEEQRTQSLAELFVHCDPEKEPLLGKAEFLANEWLEKPSPLTVNFDDPIHSSCLY